MNNVRDYYASFNRLEGPGDDYQSERHRRTLALVIDEQPFGDCRLDHPKDQEADMLANAFASTISIRWT